MSDPAALDVRKARESDLPFLKLTFLESLRAGPHQMADLSPENVERFIGDFVVPELYISDTVLVAEIEGERVGAIIVTLMRGRYTYVSRGATEHALYVVPHCRRMGFASLLRREAHVRLARLGVTWVEGIIDSANPTSLASATKSGYSPVAVVVRKSIAPERPEGNS